jgi:OmcA/MtrC family decaheme c-type cytochrome
MKIFERGLLLAVTAGTLALPSSRSTLITGRSPAGDPAAYGMHQMERYLTAEEISYIRPGLHITLNSLTNVGPGQSPVADITFADDFGQPLDYLGNATPGPLTIGFVLAWYDADQRQYTAYTLRTRNGVTNPNVDQNGTWNHIELGHSQYTFGTVLPNDLDATKTHTLAIQGKRTLTPIIGKDYFADNVIYNFRPDNAAVTDVWAAIDTNATCNNCHDPLAHHGGNRRDVRMCVLCHTPQIQPSATTGQSFDFKTMIHKIHRGANLPSVKAGGTYGFGPSDDFTTVVFPQDIRNCRKCHRDDAPQGFVWFTYPSRAACGSCHDDIDWVTGANHPAGAQADDSACSSCHVPQGDHEWDASVQGAHTVPTKSAQLQGLNATIVSVANTAPGQNPTIQFQLTNGDGSAVDPSTFGSNLSVLMSGPTTDYALDPNNFRERADGASFDGTTATYTFTHAIPTDANGTWAFSLEARRTVTLNPAPRLGPATVSEGLMNPVMYAAVTDSQPVPRRQVVDLTNCNRCHDQLILHGGLRRNTEMCVICHNPNEDDSSQRSADQLPPESVDFKRMIHRIHTGENLTQDFTIIGHGGSTNNFNDVRFPGDRRDCEKCHAAGTELLTETPPPGLLPTPTPRDWYTPQQHTAAACLGCHDTQAAAAHAFVMTAPFGEACAACHGPGDDFAVEKVHAR